MGNLKPGATYIYERADGVTYAREFGDPSSSRFPIGWDADVQLRLGEREEDMLWKNIRQAAMDNEELQYALDRVKIIYHLSKDDGQK